MHQSALFLWGMRASDIIFDFANFIHWYNFIQFKTEFWKLYWKVRETQTYE